jgi:hypothetical protein
LDAVNKYNERLQQKAAAEEKIMRAIMKERNKAVFLMNVVKTTLEKNIGKNIASVVYLLLKKAYVLIEVLRKEISIENSNSKFKSMENWEEFQLTEEFLTFSRYITEEIEEIIVYTAIVKREIDGLLAEGSSEAIGDMLRDPIFETELLSNGSLNEWFFSTMLVAYAKEVRDKAWDRSLQKEGSVIADTLKHANEILDCANLEEFFEKTLTDSALKLDDQKYFTFVKTCEKDKLQSMVNDKLMAAKMRAS